MISVAGAKGDGELVESLEKISDFLSGIGRDDLLQEVLGLKRKLLEEEFQIVVIGEFKRGKSTLVNALVGEPVLPMSVVPLTSVVTLVRGEKSSSAYVEFLDGRKEGVSLDKIPDFIAEENNPENKKGVDRVVVSTSSPFLSGGTLLVDTPGVGSIYRHNTEVAQRYLPQADAMILVLTVDPPISRSELEFLHSAKRWAKRLYIVLNKVDYISATELEKSLQFTREALRQSLGNGDISIFPVSAKRGLESKEAGNSKAWKESGMESLERTLKYLVVGEKRRLLSELVEDRAERLLGNLRLEIMLEIGTLTKTMQDIENQGASFKLILETACRKRYEFLKLYQAELKDHVFGMREGLYEYVRDQTREMMDRLKVIYQGIRHEPSSDVRAKLNKFFLNAAEESFLGYLEKEELHWVAVFQGITERYLENVTGMLNKALEEARVAAQIKHEVLHKPALTVSPPTVWFVLEEVAIWVKGFLPVPTLRMFKPVFFKTLERQVAEAMDVNAGRLCFDYETRIEETADEARKIVDNFFESSLSALEKAVLAVETRKMLTQDEVQEKEKILRARLKTIEEISTGAHFSYCL